MTYTSEVVGSYVVIALNAIVLLAVIVQAVTSQGFNSQFFYIFLSSVCMLISASLNCVLPKLRDYQRPSYILAGCFFSSVSSPLAWLVAFDVFRSVRPPNSPRSSYMAMYLGYLWAFIIIVCAAAVAGSMAQIEDNGYYGTSLMQVYNIYSTLQLVSYGLWAFPVFFGIQWVVSSPHIKKYSSTLLVYVFLLVCGVVGTTVNMAITLNLWSTRELVAANWVNFALV